MLQWQMSLLNREPQIIFTHALGPSIETGGVTMKASKVVNAAFLQELKEAHSTLWEDVNLLGAYSQEPFCADWVEQNAGGLLHRLREGLSSQFRLEETFGYVTGPEGETDEEVEAAIDQHLRIVLQCVALSEQFDDLEYSGQLPHETLGVWRAMRAMYDAILEHESLERRMLCKAWGFRVQFVHPVLPDSSMNSTPRGTI